jgi:hypothetical protein
MRFGIKRTAILVALALVTGCTTSACSPPRAHESTKQPAPAWSEIKRIQDQLRRIPGIASSTPSFYKSPLQRNVSLILAIDTADATRLIATQRYATRLMCLNAAIPDPRSIDETMYWSASLGPDAVNHGPRRLLERFANSVPGIKTVFSGLARDGRSESTVARSEVDCKKFLRDNAFADANVMRVPTELLTPVPILTAIPRP